MPVVEVFPSDNVPGAVQTDVLRELLGRVVGLADLSRPGPARSNKFQITSRTGHLTLGWDADNEQESAEAKRVFADMRERGFAFFLQNPEDQSKGEAITEFPEGDGHNVLVIAPLVGG